MTTEAPVIVTLVSTFGTIIAALAGVAVARINRLTTKVDASKEKITNIEINVDGQLSEVRKELKDATALILAMRGESEHAKGMLQVRRKRKKELK